MTSWPANHFNPSCTECSRLDMFLQDVRANHPDYYAAPVPPFGDPQAQLLIVGLAPGYHGANRTGRPFTGDYSGVLLYDTLYKYGFSNLAQSVSADDKLVLKNCRISNAVKCLPPENKPTTEEIKFCNQYLAAELADLPDKGVIVALGLIAHNAVLRAFNLKNKDYKFAHNASYMLPNEIRLISSYHCSRYNTQTRRLTEEMFHAVFENAKQQLI